MSVSESERQGHITVESAVLNRGLCANTYELNHCVCHATLFKSSQFEHSATCGDIQWNEMSCLTGPRCYINTGIQQ